MKKLLALLLVMMLIMTSFTACGSKDDAEVENPDTNLEQDAEASDEEADANADADAEEEGKAEADDEADTEAEKEDEAVKEDKQEENTKASDKKEEQKPADKKEESKPADKKEENKTENKPVSGSTAGPSISGTPVEIIDKIYAQYPVADLPLGTMEVDIADPDALKMITGLDSADKISAAAYSEPMMGAQAYSMVVVKVKDSKDAKAVASEMASGIDKRKWICVEADDLSVGAAGDVVVLMMVDSSFAETVTSKNIIDAFSTAAGGLDVRL